MTREEAIDWLCRLKSEIKIFMPYQWQKPFEEALDMAIKALSQEPCDDAISRILKRMWNCRGKHTTSIDKVAMKQIIRDELSVTQKSGRWKVHRKYYECSSCGSQISNEFFVSFKYCPHCGAKMEREDKE